MSVMERRLQLLLDEQRYRRVAAEAERSGRSVAAVIRESIDWRFPDDGAVSRQQAALKLLSMTEVPDVGPAEDWREQKRRYESQVDEVMDRL